MKNCSVETCERRAVRHGWCKMHAARWDRTGDPEGLIRSGGWYEPLGDKLRRIGWTITSNGCWEWRGYRTKQGYGQIAVPGTRKSVPVHRVAYETWIGPIPDDQPIVRHKCDNPPCINPEHLEIGTQADNVQDKVVRGRCIRGESLSWAKMTDETVLEMRQKFSSGISRAILAKQYGISWSMADKICSGKSWTHLL